MTTLKHVSLTPEMRAATPRRRSLFWDVDPMKVDPEKNARYVIERIMDFGTDEEVRWMWKAYPREVLHEVASLPRGIHPRSKPLWSTLTA